MLSAGSGGPVVAGLLLLLPAGARAQGLDPDATSFLNDVRPLILPEEKATFEKLGDKADRIEFQKIFWARRNTDLATPGNEFQREYEKDRAIADQRYSVPGTAGSAGHLVTLAQQLSGETRSRGAQPTPRR